MGRVLSKVLKEDLISVSSNNYPVMSELGLEAMSSHIRSMSCILFRITVSMNLCGGRRVVFRRIHTLLVPLSRSMQAVVIHNGTYLNLPLATPLTSCVLINAPQVGYIENEKYTFWEHNIMDQELSVTQDGESVIVGGYLN